MGFSKRDTILLYIESLVQSFSQLRFLDLMFLRVCILLEFWIGDGFHSLMNFYRQWPVKNILTGVVKMGCRCSVDVGSRCANPEKGDSLEIRPALDHQQKVFMKVIWSLHNVESKMSSFSSSSEWLSNMCVGQHYGNHWKISIYLLQAIYSCVNTQNNLSEEFSIQNKFARMTLSLHCPSI